MQYDHVIVGGGLAGGMIAQELREQGGEGSVLLVAGEAHPPYHRPPLTKQFLRGEQPSFDTYMHPAVWWEEQRVDLRLGVTVRELDLKRRQVELQGGERIGFEKLALATGSTPRELPGAVSIRTIEDSQRVQALLETGSGRLGVIGGGFIGVETAASATMKGLEVTMAVRESVVWEHLFGSEVAGYFQRTLESHGVRVLNGTPQLPPDESFDLVVAGIGVTPNIGLAAAAGLPTASGVLVDDHLSAGDGVWAAGDIAEYQSVVHGGRIRVEHWDVALNQGAYVGRVWAGKQDGPYDVVPYFFSDIGDWTWFEYVGPGRGQVSVRGSMDADDFSAYWTGPGGAVTACLGVNRSDEVNAAKELIAGHLPPPAA